MLRLEILFTSEPSRLSSKWSIGNHNTMQYLGAPLSLDSWPSHTTPTSSSKCQGQKESSRSTGTFKGQIHVTVTSAKSQRCMGWSNHSPNSRFLTTAHFSRNTRG